MTRYEIDLAIAQAQYENDQLTDYFISPNTGRIINILGDCVKNLYDISGTIPQEDLPLQIAVARYVQENMEELMEKCVYGEKSLKTVLVEAGLDKRMAVKAWKGRTLKDYILELGLRLEGKIP